MKQKIFWFDVETTGLDPNDDEIIALSARITYNDEIIDHIDLKFRPVNTIHPMITQLTGITQDDSQLFPIKQTSFLYLKDFLKKYVNPYNRDDKFIIGGYNVQFDIKFLRKLFENMGDQYYGSWFQFKPIDPYKMICGLDDMSTTFPIERKTLKHVCNYFKIELDAHNAGSDIDATIKLYNILLKDGVNKILYDSKQLSDNT